MTLKQVHGTMGGSGRWLLAKQPVSAQFPLPALISVGASSAEEGSGVIEAISVRGHH